jgi:hypothetical protein
MASLEIENRGDHYAAYVSPWGLIGYGDTEEAAVTRVREMAVVMINGLYAGHQRRANAVR